MTPAAGARSGFLLSFSAIRSVIDPVIQPNRTEDPTMAVPIPHIARVLTVAALASAVAVGCSKKVKEG